MEARSSCPTLAAGVGQGSQVVATPAVPLGLSYLEAVQILDDNPTEASSDLLFVCFNVSHSFALPVSYLVSFRLTLVDSALLLEGAVDNNGSSLFV
jgi:spore maturation protein SpmA